jgi:MFS family permease
VNASSPWRPLRAPLFRNLLAANVVSDMGAFMQTVGAAWLMVSLHGGPLYVALIQTASALPFFVFALPAGAVGDIVDRRRLILVTETWMLVTAVAIAVATIAGAMTPWLLLALTFALSAGDAIETPTWRAILPELVGKEDLAAASALSGIEFNFARAVGPAAAGLLIAMAGVGAAFTLNAVSFLGVIVVIARWRRPVNNRTTPRETVRGATVAALRYVRYAQSLRGLMLRSGTTMFFASALLALLPSVAHSVSGGSAGYGVLLGCFGAGAVVGAVVLPRARARFSTETVAVCGVVLLGLSIITTSALHRMPFLSAVVLVAGAAWIVFISLMNALMQLLAPDWVRARVLAVFMLVFQGALAVGSAMWGAIADRGGLHIALVAAGIGVLLSAALGRVASLPDTTADTSPWIHWRLPAVVSDAGPRPDAGPVLVMSQYIVSGESVRAFLDAMDAYARVRRRDGAYRWGVFRDVENAGSFVETFLVSSWAEHLRQHERSTQADREIEQRVLSLATGDRVVRHYVSPRE